MTTTRSTLATRFGPMRIQFGGGGPDHVRAWAGSNVNAPDSPEHVPYITLIGVEYALRVDLHCVKGGWIVKDNSPITSGRADSKPGGLSHAAQRLVQIIIIPAMIEWAKSHPAERGQAEREWINEEMTHALAAQSEARLALATADSRIASLLARSRLLAELDEEEGS